MPEIRDYSPFTAEEELELDCIQASPNHSAYLFALDPEDRKRVYLNGLSAIC